MLSALGPQQQQFCEYISGGYLSLEEIQDKLGLTSTEEAEQFMADLLTQLKSAGVEPQEVYAAELAFEDGEINAHYYATAGFTEVASQYGADAEAAKETGNLPHGRSLRAAFFFSASEAQISISAQAIVQPVQSSFGPFFPGGPSPVCNRDSSALATRCVRLRELLRRVFRLADDALKIGLADNLNGRSLRLKKR